MANDKDPKYIAGMLTPAILVGTGLFFLFHQPGQERTPEENQNTSVQKGPDDRKQKPELKNELGKVLSTHPQSGKK